jgi:ATP-dependent Clp protease adaptor protein ClpS
MCPQAPKTGDGTAADSRQEVKPPRMFRVLMHNDDYTTMEFVVDVLQDIFNKSQDEAVRIMLSIHHKGLGLCGVYTAQIAETKAARVHDKAQSQGFPLRCSVEPE